jgi:membrane protease YdiL (CAAX protease family)
MTILLGENPWILILITPLELLLIFIPAFITAKVEKTSLLAQFKNILLLKAEGHRLSKNSVIQKILKITMGLIWGVILFLIGTYIFLFFRFIVENLFGTYFISHAEGNAISTQVFQPTMVQIIILIIFQFIIVALSEEAFFRSFLLVKLSKRIKLWFSIIISSTLFTLYHTPPFLVPISTIITFSGYYFSLGLFLSLVFIFHRKSLLLVIICHGVYNMLLIIF